MENVAATEGNRKARRNVSRAAPAKATPAPKTTAVHLDITVLMGGPSSEREVSLASGSAVAAALERLGHKVTRSDISPQDTSALDRQGADLVFIVLHGAFGESGEVQELCESRGLRYTGSGVRASELAIDKAATKRICRDAGIPTADWAVVEEMHSADQVAGLCLPLPPPVVLKPIDGGSSVDVVIAQTAAERDRELERLVDKYGRCMMERFVKGRELTAGILGEQALPVLEIVPARAFYDQEAKYADDAGTRYEFEHGIEPAIVERIQAHALAAHRALGCRDLSRIDFILDPGGTAWLLEINNIPGFTSHSLLPKAAERIGISFDQLVQRLVDMAMKR